MLKQELTNTFTNLQNSGKNSCSLNWVNKEEVPLGQAQDSARHMAAIHTDTLANICLINSTTRSEISKFAHL